MTANNIPTEKDWDDWSNDKPYDQVSEWDRAYAKKNFLGVSATEAHLMFKQNFMRYLDDFFEMPKICFHYYFIALCTYLTNHLNDHDCDKHGNYIYDISDAASCFFGIIDYRSKFYPKSIKELKSELLPYIDIISKNQRCFDADIEIYGSFLEKAEEIKSKLSAL